jgi:hypothetical protein
MCDGAGAQAPQATLRVVRDRADGLIDLVRQAGDHLAQRVQTQDMGELGLMLPQRLRDFLPLDDFALQVLLRGFERCGAHPYALLELLVQRAYLFLDALALGDVGERRHGADDVSARVAHRCRGNLDVGTRSVRVTDV